MDLKEILDGYTEARKRLTVLRVAEYGENDFVWNKLYRVDLYLKRAQTEAAEAYFADTEVAA